MYSETCFNRTSLGLKNFFGFGWCSVLSGSQSIQFDMMVLKNKFGLFRFSVYAGFGLARFHCSMIVWSVLVDTQFKIIFETINMVFFLSRLSMGMWHTCLFLFISFFGSWNGWPLLIKTPAEADQIIFNIFLQLWQSTCLSTKLT